MLPYELRFLPSKHLASLRSQCIPGSTSLHLECKNTAHWHSRFRCAPSGMLPLNCMASLRSQCIPSGAALQLGCKNTLPVHASWSCAPPGMPQVSPTLPRVGEMTQVCHTFRHAISHIMNLLKLKHSHWQKYTTKL